MYYTGKCRSRTDPPTPKKRLPRSGRVRNIRNSNTPPDGNETPPRPGTARIVLGFRSFYSWKRNRKKRKIERKVARAEYTGKRGRVLYFDGNRIRVVRTKTSYSIWPLKRPSASPPQTVFNYLFESFFYRECDLRPCPPLVVAVYTVMDNIFFFFPRPHI